MRTSLTIRIFLGFFAILVAFGATTLFGIYRMDSIRQDLRITSQGYMPLTQALARVKTIAESKDAYVERALEEEDPRLRPFLVRYARDFYPRVLRERLAELAASARALGQQKLPAADARFAQEIVSRLDRIIELNTLAEQASNTFFEHLSASQPASSSDALKRLRERAEALSRELKLISLNLDNKVAQGVLRAETKERNAVWALVALSAIVLMVGLIITLLMARTLSPLKKLTEAAHAVSRGSFDVQLPDGGTNEIGTLATAFSQMARALKDRETSLAGRGIEVERLNAFLESVLHSVTTGVIVCDRQRIVTVVNRAGRRLLGYTLVDPVGTAVADLPLTPLLNDHEKDLERVLCDGPALLLEAQALKPISGPTFLIDLRVQPFRQPDAPLGIGGMVFLLDDVSERESTRERLLQNERLAAMGRLAAQVAHEIRNPLSSIGLNCELLGDELRDDGSRNDEIEHLLAAIAREIDRLTELTEGYLRYARLPDADKRPSDLGALVKDLAQFVRVDFERKGLSLEVAVDNDLPTLLIDPARIRLALINLLRNAADVSASGQHVRISATRLDDKVIVAVEDEGPGVEAANIGHLFKPFFSTKADGTGLGLSMTLEVAREHGGDAAYQKRSDQGSRFVLKLPAAAG